MLPFKTLSQLTAFIASALFVVLLAVPELLFFIFAVDGNAEAYFFGRRAAMLFLGFAVLAWAGRNAALSQSRQAVCLAISVSMLAMAGLGVAEYLRGFAGAGIALAVLTEGLLAYLHFSSWWAGRNEVMPQQ